MIRWFFRIFGFAAVMVVFRLLAGHFFPSWDLPLDGGLAKIQEKVSEALPKRNLGPFREQIPLPVADYRRMGFPAAVASGSWVKRDLSEFHRALGSMPHDRRASFPGADGDYGKSAFSMITKLETSFPSLRIEDQGVLLKLIAAIHETYRRAHDEDRIRYDREISLLRGIYVALTDHMLRKIRIEMQDLRSEISSATGTLGSGSQALKQHRKAMANGIMQTLEGEMGRAVSDSKKSIEGFLKDMTDVPTLRPQAKKITLRYMERHLASIHRQIGGDYEKWIRKDLDRTSDPEIKELHRRLLATFEEK